MRVPGCSQHPAEPSRLFPIHRSRRGKRKPRARRLPVGTALEYTLRKGEFPRSQNFLERLIPCDFPSNLPSKSFRRLLSPKLHRAKFTGSGASHPRRCRTIRFYTNYQDHRQKVRAENSRSGGPREPNRTGRNGDDVSGLIAGTLSSR